MQRWCFYSKPLFFFSCADCNPHEGRILFLEPLHQFYSWFIFFLPSILLLVYGDNLVLHKCYPNVLTVYPFSTPYREIAICCTPQPTLSFRLSVWCLPGQTALFQSPLHILKQHLHCRGRLCNALAFLCVFQLCAFDSYSPHVSFIIIPVHSGSLGGRIQWMDGLRLGDIAASRSLLLSLVSVPYPNTIDLWWRDTDANDQWVQPSSQNTGSAERGQWTLSSLRIPDIILM